MSPAVGKCVPILSHQPLKLPEFCLRAARVEDCHSQAADGRGGGSEATGKQRRSGMGGWSGEVTCTSWLLGALGCMDSGSHRPRPSSATTCWDFGPGARFWSCPGCWGSHGNVTALAFPTSHVPPSGALFAEYPFPRCSQAHIIHLGLSSTAPPQRAVPLPSALSSVLMSSQHYGYLEVSYLFVV